MKLLLILMKIFVIGALLIISNQNLAMSLEENRTHFVGEYSLWVQNLFEKSLSIASYVIKNEWLPETPN